MKVSWQPTIHIRKYHPNLQIYPSQLIRWIRVGENWSQNEHKTLFFFLTWTLESGGLVTWVSKQPSSLLQAIIMSSTTSRRPCRIVLLKDLSLYFSLRTLVKVRFSPPVYIEPAIVVDMSCSGFRPNAFTT